LQFVRWSFADRLAQLNPAHRNRSYSGVLVLEQVESDEGTDFSGFVVCLP